MTKESVGGTYVVQDLMAVTGYSADLDAKPLVAVLSHTHLTIVDCVWRMSRTGEACRTMVART